MSTDRLFTIGAIFAFVVALLDRLNVMRPNAGIFVAGVGLPAFYWEGFAAIAGAALALSYFAVSRTVPHAPNRAIGAISFALVFISFAAMVVESLYADKFFTNNLFVWIFFGAMFAFLIGVVLSAINLAWAVFRQALPASN
jgi:hypothetical protein